MVCATDSPNLLSLARLRADIVLSSRVLIATGPIVTVKFSVADDLRQHYLWQSTSVRYITLTKLGSSCFERLVADLGVSSIVQSKNRMAPRYFPT